MRLSTRSSRGRVEGGKGCSSSWVAIAVAVGTSEYGSSESEYHRILQLRLVVKAEVCSESLVDGSGDELGCEMREGMLTKVGMKTAGGLCNMNGS